MTDEGARHRSRPLSAWPVWLCHRPPPIPGIETAVVCLWLLASLVGLGATDIAAANAGKTPQTIAVLDFDTADVSHESLNWLSEGVADLVQTKLTQAGVMTVDRDLIRAVLDEQDLTHAGVVAAEERIEIGRLLGAQRLLRGRVEVQPDQRFVLSAEITAVRDIEVVATGRETGVYPDDFLPAIERLVDALASELARAPALPAEGLADTPPLAALTLFYRGIEACARGWPEQGVGWFLAVQQIAPDFHPARAWEYRAYRLAGFDGHAAIARERMIEHVGEEDALAIASAAFAGDDETRVVAFLPPMRQADAQRTLSDAGEEVESLLTDLRQQLERAALEIKGVRVFSHAMLEQVAAEFDLTLSDRFDIDTVPRYGRWLAADALVLSRWAVGDDGGPTLDLQLRDALSGRVLATHKMPLATSRAPRAADLEAALGRLFDQWAEADEPAAPQPMPEQAAPLPPWEDEFASYQRTARLAQLLNNLRMDKNVPESRLGLVTLLGHSYLIHAFKKTEHARLELDLVFREISADDPLEAYWVYRGYRIAAQEREPDSEQILRTYRPRLHAMAEKHAESLPAIAIWYLRGMDSWEQQEWEDAARFMTKAKEGIARPAARSWLASKREHSDKERQRAIHLRLLVCHFVLAESYSEMREEDRAVQHFDKAQHYLDSLGDIRNTRLPGPPSLRVDDEGRMYTRLSSGYPYEFSRSVERTIRSATGNIEDEDFLDVLDDALDRLENTSRNDIRERAAAMKRLHRGMELLIDHLNAGRGELDEEYLYTLPWRQRVTEAVGTLQRDPTSTITDEAFHQLIDGIAQAMRYHFHLDRLDQDPEPDYYAVLRALGTISWCYQAAGLHEKAIRAYAPLFNDDIPFKHEFRAFSRIHSIRIIDSDVYRELRDRIWDRADREGRQMPWRARFQRARQHHESGEIAKAIQLYESVTDVPDHQYRASSKYFLAQLYEQLDKHDRAARLLREVVDITAGQKIHLRMRWRRNVLREPTLDQRAADRLEAIHAAP